MEELRTRGVMGQEAARRLADDALSSPAPWGQRQEQVTKYMYLAPLWIDL